MKHRGSALANRASGEELSLADEFVSRIDALLAEERTWIWSTAKFQLNHNQHADVLSKVQGLFVAHGCIHLWSIGVNVMQYQWSTPTTRPAAVVEAVFCIQCTYCVQCQQGFSSKLENPCRQYKLYVTIRYVTINLVKQSSSKTADLYSTSQGPVM